MKIIAVALLCLLAYTKTQGIERELHSYVPLTLPDDGKQMTIEEKLKKYEGAFQIQVKSMRMKPNIPYNIDELIEKNRKQNENVIISLGTYVRLKIFSVNEAKSNAGKKIPMITPFKD